MSALMGRTSFEKLAIDVLAASVPAVPGLTLFRGQMATNKTQPTGWALTSQQFFQFGDLRIEAPTVRIVVEVESAGGETNLVKYWPMLETGLRDKRFVLLHLFRTLSVGDYITHRQLWTHLRDRMRFDLGTRCDLAWERDWSAEMLTYGLASESDGLATAAARIRTTLVGPERSAG
jgi:hypothetical protein